VKQGATRATTKATVGAKAAPAKKTTASKRKS
jgi:hypothetical protein